MAALARSPMSRREEDLGLEARLPKNYARKLWRAIMEFELISEGDRILVGFSGGKDSSFLLYALAATQPHFPKRFELGAATIDLGFGDSGEASAFDPVALGRFCEGLGVPFHLRRTNIAAVAFSEGARENPCAVCAHLRRGALNNLALESGYNKVALAHHHDDAIETFLMSIIYSGQVQTFLPKTFLDHTGITVIRPLVYFRESELVSAKRLTGYEPLPTCCPMSGKSKRAEIKRLVRELVRANPKVYTNLGAAIRRDSVRELWPELPGREEMARKYREMFHGG